MIVLILMAFLIGLWVGTREALRAFDRLISNLPMSSDEQDICRKMLIIAGKDYIRKRLHR